MTDVFMSVFSFLCPHSSFFAFCVLLFQPVSCFTLFLLSFGRSEFTVNTTWETYVRVLWVMLSLGCGYELLVRSSRYERLRLRVLYGLMKWYTGHGSQATNTNYAVFYYARRYPTPMMRARGLLLVLCT